MGNINKNFEENNERLKESCQLLEHQVDKMTEENQKFEDNNEKLEEKVALLEVRTKPHFYSAFPLSDIGEERF